MIQLGVIEIRSLDGTIADVKERLLLPCKVINEMGNFFPDHDLLTEIFGLHCANSEVAFEKPSRFKCELDGEGVLRMFAIFTRAPRIAFDPVACLESLRQYLGNEVAPLTKEDLLNQAVRNRIG